MALFWASWGLLEPSWAPLGVILGSEGAKKCAGPMVGNALGSILVYFWVPFGGTGFDHYIWQLAAGKASGHCWRLLEAARGGWMCSEHCVLSVKVPKSLVSRSVWSLDMDFDGKFTVTYDTHRSGDTRTDFRNKGFRAQPPGKQYV